MALKRLAPTVDVQVFDGRTQSACLGEGSGGGLVFGQSAWEAVDAVDGQVARQVRSGAVLWDSMEVRRGKESLELGGQPFWGVDRGALLGALAERCVALGVPVHWNTATLGTDADLVVAADGSRSEVRDSMVDVLGVQERNGTNVFCWFRCGAALDRFVFDVQPMGEGVAVAHRYPSAGGSTAVIEVTARAWEGLRGLDEATRNARVLGWFGLCDAQPLGPWRPFVSVRCERWSYGSESLGAWVLLGDAAHCNHFSVGQGTELALSGAVALAGSVADHGDVDGALLAYGERHRSKAESVRRGAVRSQRWFEQLELRMDCSMGEFAFGLLSRTYRMTHSDLSRRDPAFTRQVVGKEKPLPMLRPLTVRPIEGRGVELANRVVVSPMGMYASEQGVPGEVQRRNFETWAQGGGTQRGGIQRGGTQRGGTQRGGIQGGAGLIMTEMTNVEPQGRITPRCAGLYTDAQEDAWRTLVDLVHATGEAKVGVQLGHAGRKGSTHPPSDDTGASGDPLEDEQGWETVAASPLAWDQGFDVPREMTRKDMDRVREAFVASAVRAARAGFDWLEIHAAHGYLLSGFLTPVSNQRGDEYGGTMENRARFPLEVIRVVRKVWDGPLSVRISATDWVPDGISVEDVLWFVQALQGIGVDVIDVSAGQTTPHAKPEYGRLWQTHLAETIRLQTGMITMAVGGYRSHDDINTTLLAGRADLVAVGRAHLGNPGFVRNFVGERGGGLRSVSTCLRVGVRCLGCNGGALLCRVRLLVPGC